MDHTSALNNAWDVQTAASQLGFDWPDITGAFTKVEEEVSEIREAMMENDDTHVQEELGDLLFAVVNLSRFVNLRPEIALNRATQKFQRRFDAVKQIIQEENRTLAECTLAEMDAVWERVKGAE
ncbi:MAG: MazG nucleotide pyrophosphohydrolase domain-containing protein [Candidatus Hydrogenedentota bacterium]